MKKKELEELTKIAGELKRVLDFSEPDEDRSFETITAWNMLSGVYSKLNSFLGRYNV